MLNSTITLDQIVVASKASGISIADLVLAIDSANKPAMPIAPEAGVNAEPSIAAAPARKASKPKAAKVKKSSAASKHIAKVADKPMREVAITDGKGQPTGKTRMMPAAPSTVTKNQKANIIGFCDKHGFFYPANLNSMSVATASEQYSMLKAAI
jgi:hypothetical protein